MGYENSTHPGPTIQDHDWIMGALEEEDYTSATIDEKFGTADTARASRLEAKYLEIKRRRLEMKNNPAFQESTYQEL